MGKRKGGFKKARKGVDLLKDVGSSDDEYIEKDLEAILDDEIDSYNTYKEESLKSKTKPKKRAHVDSDEEKEVFGLDVSDDDEELEEDIQLESEGEEDDDEEEDDDDDQDILGGGQDDMEAIPDSHAWGRKARLYHNTDYVDQDFGGFEGSDAELAEQEELEAKEIQKRLTAELDEDAFADFIPSKEPTKKVEKGQRQTEVMKLDFDSMTLTEKRKLIERECPEVIHMLDEYKAKLKIAQGIKSSMDSSSEELVKQFYYTKYHTILNYCINIAFYLYLRATAPANCKGHPVIKRILQFRRLLDELEQFDPTKVTRAIGLVRQFGHLAIPTVRTKSKAKVVRRKTTGQTDNTEPAVAEGEEMEEGKRKITYEMAKNKGLTPARSKMQRNPRVKHRMKFRKATIRRKGQVRTPRTEVRKYDGELSGIKAHVTKSIKLK